MPERFDLTYVGPDGQDHRVVMIHRAIYGSIDRFMGILVEHFGGKFPVWISPVQAKLLTVSDKFIDYGKEVYAKMKKAKVRVENDFSPEKLGYKIRQATMEKNPYMCVIGEKEAAEGTVSVRTRDGEDLGAMKVEQFIDKILDEVKNKR
jgi:threonyl-tRNA synthetase